MAQVAGVLGLLLLVVVVTPLLGGCTYSSAIDERFYQANARYDNPSQKLPLAIGIVKDSNVDNMTFSASGGGHSVDIAIGQALLSSIDKEFKTLFTSVGVVETPNRGVYDLYAYLDANWDLVAKNDLAGDQSYVVRFSVTFRDTTLSRTVARYSDSRTVHYHPPAGALAASAATGASLFLLSPLTVPATTFAVGAKAKDMVKDTIAASVRGLGDRIAADGKLHAYAPQLSDGRSQRGDEAEHRPGRVTSASSKYEHRLDGVVVVEAGSGFGSGFLVSEDGYIVSSAHVVGIHRFVRVRFRSGEVLPGAVLDVDLVSDLALIEVSGTGFRALDLSTGTDALLGNEVLAIGTPKGLSWSISKGIVSALRDLEDVQLIQTDAAINTGNSGGPLIDLKSERVIGVNAMTYRKDLSEGLNFAVSVEAIWEAFGSRFSS